MHWFQTGCVPNPCRTICACRGNPLSIRAERYGPNFAAERPASRADFLAGVGIPKCEGSIGVARYQPLTVGTIGHTVEWIVQGRQRENRMRRVCFQFRRQVPYLNGPIAADRRETAAIRMERQAGI